jgi:hypothetical protein
MEFPNLPAAYETAVDFSRRAAQADGSWKRLADAIAASQRSFQWVGGGAPVSDAQFAEFQSDAGALDTACQATGVFVLEH